MKTTRIALLAAFTVTATIALNASEPTGMAQRAAATHLERGAISARDTALPSFVVGARIAGKHAAQAVESSRAVTVKSSVDLAHAPRPVTAGKDADLDRKWRDNAAAVQVAPLK